MLKKRFLPAFFILCVLLVGCAFAASSEQPKDEALPGSPGMISALDIQDIALESFFISDPLITPARPLYALLLGVGEQKQLGVVVSPDNATNQRVEWKTLPNQNIAQASQTGLIESIGEEGKTTITVTADQDGVQEQTLEVIVANPRVRVKDIYMYQQGAKDITSEDITISVIVGTSVNLVAVLQPAQPGIRRIDWYSANDDIAEIRYDPATPTNATVTALRDGITNIEAVTLDGLKRRVCKVISYIEEKGAVEGGCATGILPSAAGIAILAPLLLLFRRKSK